MFAGNRQTAIAGKQKRRCQQKAEKQHAQQAGEDHAGGLLPSVLLLPLEHKSERRDHQQQRKKAEYRHEAPLLPGREQHRDPDDRKLHGADDQTVFAVRFLFVILCAGPYRQRDLQSRQKNKNDQTHTSHLSFFRFCCPCRGFGFLFKPSGGKMRFERIRCTAKWL